MTMTMSDMGVYFLSPNHTFDNVCHDLLKLLLAKSPTSVASWQSHHVADKPQGSVMEVLNYSFQLALPDTVEHLAEIIKPNLPWAEDHFQERVSGEPLNPPPSAEHWPHAQHSNEAFKDGGKFSHTYPERFWPKFAGEAYEDMFEADDEKGPRAGIRYDYGDLLDVLVQLQKDPSTRQAYLPVWFPEDTGAVDGQRVPCTLGYHFLIRDDKLQITYYIRSCDFVRHFRDDVYMAGRLAQWMAQGLGISPSLMVMHIVNMHAFEADKPLLRHYWRSLKNHEATL
jgi:hypothetical protein